MIRHVVPPTLSSTFLLLYPTNANSSVVHVREPHGQVPVFKVIVLVHFVSSEYTQKLEACRESDKMDEFESHYPHATTTTTTNPESHDENAVVLASLIQELSFWEPSAHAQDSIRFNSDSNKSSGLIRRSRSVNDATVTGQLKAGDSTTSSNRQRLLHSISYNGSESGEGINRDTSSISNTQGYQQHQNIFAYDSTGINGSSDYIGSGRNDGDQFPSSRYTNGCQDEKQEQQQQHHQQQPKLGSPTLVELQKSCFWNKAIDPASGRTYYYDIRTRHTQWEKVGLINVLGCSICRFLIDELCFFCA